MSASRRTLRTGRAQKLRNDGLAGGEHLVDLFRLFAAGLGKIRAAAAAAADDGRDLLHDLTGLYAPREIRRDRDDDLHLAVVRRREDHDAALDLRLQRISEATKRVLVEIAQLAPRKLDAINVDRV